MSGSVQPDKHCSGCDETKPRSEFYVRALSKDGLQAHCKLCNRRTARESYRRRNDIPVDHALYFRRDPSTSERARALRQQWMESHPEEVRRYGREFRRREQATDPEMVRRRAAVYRASSKCRRAICRGATAIPFTAKQLEQRMSMWGHRCWICGGPEEAVDHVKPVTKGGWHCLSNLRPVCFSCNSSKNNRWPFAPYPRTESA